MSSKLLLRLTLALALPACADEPELQVRAASACKTDLRIGETQEFAVIGAATEGIAFSPDGRLFASSRKKIWEIAPDGTPKTFATLDDALGLAFQGKTLLVAGIGVDKIFSVSPAGAVAVYAGEVSNPNFVVSTPWGTALAANDEADSSFIFEIVNGQSTVWSEAVATPNGMAFSSDAKSLFVAATFEDPGLYRLPIANKKAGPVEVIASGGLFKGSTPDGLAIARDGSIFVALNTGRKVVRVTTDGQVEVVASELVFPASLAFGQGEFDACSIYSTQLFGKAITRIAVGQPGQE